MHLSRLADYAVVLMTHIGQHPGPVHTVTDVAIATGIPAPTAAKLLAKLARRGLLSSTRGVKGGYALARLASTISIGEIVAVLDGPIALTQCIKDGPGGCDLEPVCPSRVGLHRINVAVRKALDDVSLADIATPALAVQVTARRALPHRLSSAKAHR